MKDSKKIIIMYGPPGAGKDTQARYLVKKFNLHQVSSSALIEKKIYNPHLANDPIIQRERENYERGILCTPSWVTELINQEVDRLAQQGLSLIFTGSPRTLYEAENEIPYWESLYGKENIHIIVIKVKPETSIFRNSHRRICKNCGLPIIYSSETKDLKACPYCGGEIITRGTLDDPETIKIRLKEYQERTEPILDYLKERGYQLIEIDGEPSPEEVKKEIFSKIQPFLGN